PAEKFNAAVDRLDAIIQSGEMTEQEKAQAEQFLLGAIQSAESAVKDASELDGEGVGASFGEGTKTGAAIVAVLGIGKLNKALKKLKSSNAHSDLNIGKNNPNYSSTGQEKILNNRGVFDQKFGQKLSSENEVNAAWRVYQEANKSGKELVIGRLDDAKAGSKIGMQRLNDPDWTINVNDAWVQGGIDAKKNFYLGSSETAGNLWDLKNNRPTVLAREIQQLKNAGYVKKADYYIHPSNIGR
ncbi:MAG: hypothetical protein JKY80_01390, partial [Mariprofundaceae bacterium]|nr:hypothetical protein [Mariprofundaceae bacterium]